MTALTYYVAASLDGFIATPDGGIDWLSVTESEGEDYGYAEFYDSIDALVMGRATYEQILGFGEWPYPDKPSWVLTRQTLKSDRSDITIANESPADALEAMVNHGYRNVWLIGGGALAGAFLADGLITDTIVSVIPVILGTGIRLFGESGAGTSNLQLVDVTPYPTGVAQLHYRHR